MSNKTTTTDLRGTTARARAGKNRTLVLSDEDRSRLLRRLIREVPPAGFMEPPQGIVLGDCLRVAGALPRACVDLLILDPPYNLTKSFRGRKFTRRTVDAYARWLDGVLVSLKPALKPTASVYLCSEWFSSASVYSVAATHFVVRNRITWEREKGRGARANWKNTSEDVWFCTVSDDYIFNVDDVKLRRKVVAPYRNGDGTPRGWDQTNGSAFRDTYPSNLWTDVTVPFWSMPENTEHPTQKSEKLLARLILASSKPGDLILDPFLGSGTTAVVARKLQRRCLGIEIIEEYCLLAELRLERALTCPEIQGFAEGVFWERNSMPGRRKQP